jgi:4-amino-4-deoxy-L-arabinose transferase-like glycosyltransferase
MTQTLRNQEILLRTSVLFLFLWIIHEGIVGPAMDNDGVLYASIAKHMAEGYGSVWFPYSPLEEASFHHHPPLAFALQSLFFRLLGDAFWVENVYQITFLILLLSTIAGIWRLSTDSKSGVWLAWFFLLTMPLIAFSYTDNLLEVTLGFFTTFAIFCHLNSLRSKHPYAWTVLAGISTCAAVLSKGPVGLFPLTALLLLAWALRIELKHTVKCYAVHISTLVVFWTVIMLVDNSRQSLSNYVNFQLMGTMEGRLANLHGRTYILFELGRQIPIPLLTVIGLCVWVRPHFDRITIAWLAIALSAWLPLTISPRQFDHYIVPALPHFAIFLALLVRPAIAKIPRLQTKALQSLALVMIAGFVFSSIKNYGELDNDYDAFHDLTIIQQSIPKGMEIGRCTWQEPLARYERLLNRYHSIRVVSGTDKKYVLCNTPSVLSRDFRQIAPKLKLVPLYARNEQFDSTQKSFEDRRYSQVGGLTSSE